MDFFKINDDDDYDDDDDDVRFCLNYLSCSMIHLILMYHLNYDSKFCYLSDMLDAGKGLDEAWCTISHEGKYFQGLCPECVDIWD